MGKWKKAVAALAAVPMLMRWRQQQMRLIGYHRFIGRTAGAGSSPEIKCQGIGRQ